MATTEAPSERKIKDAFGYITEALEKLKKKDPKVFTEANIKIAAFIRNITDGKFINLPIYHATDAVDDEAKFQTYKLIFNALIAPGGPKLSMLDNVQEPGPVAEEPSKEKPAAPNPKRPAPETTSVPTTGRTVTPKAAPVNSDAGEAETLVTELLRVVDRATRAEITRFREIEFEDLLKKHLSNGSFPTNRVEEVVAKLQSPAVSEDRIRQIIREENAALQQTIGKNIGIAIAEALGVTVSHE